LCLLSLLLHTNAPNLNHDLDCCFLSYGVTQKGYRRYDPIAKRLRISRHVEFWEHKMFTSISPFPQSSSSYAPVFTDPSITLVPDSSIEMLSSSNAPSSTVPESPDTTADTPAPSTAPEPN
jgi:hypothetical protein